MELSDFELDYEEDRRKHEIFISGDSSQYIVCGPPVVTYQGFLQLSQRGQIIGRVDADFDFSNVPPELHMTALGWLTQYSTRLELGLFHDDK